MNEILLNDLAMNDFDNFKNLPLAVYLTRIDGIIIDFNNEAKDLLELDDSDKGIMNILKFYQFPEERDVVIEKLNKKNDGEWTSNETLIFKVNSKIINLRFFAKAYKSQEGNLIGSLCLVFKITGFERFRQFEESIPLGLFEISKGNSITYRNKKFNEILGIEHAEDVDKITNFFLSKEMRDEYTKIIQELRVKGEIKDKVIDLIRKDDKTIVGKFNVLVDEFDSNGLIMKSKGVLEDVTHNDILEDGPIGLFSLKQTSKGLVIGYCNQYFSDVFSNGNIKECFGAEFKNLFNNDSLYDPFKDAINQLSYNELIKDYYVEFKTESNSRELVFHIKRLQNRSNFVRYTGVVYDVSYDVEKRLGEWKKNFAAFLHSYSSMCNSIKDTLQGIISAHATEVVKKGRVDIDIAYSTIKGRISGYKTIFEKYSTIYRERGIKNEYTDKLDKSLIKLFEIEKEGITQDTLTTVRSLFINIKNIINKYEEKELMPNQLRKSLEYEISEILRYTRLLSLYYIEEETFEMTTNIEEIKQIVIFGNEDIEFERFDLIGVLRKSMRNLQEFATRRNIDLKLQNSLYSISIESDPGQLYFAFYNILNNAIKYSWSRSGDRNPFVEINVKNNILDIEVVFVNRGVAILPEEIQSGSLFSFKKRGLASKDRRRKGTGIGLWHTHKIITQLNGEISITSRPIESAFPNDYGQPFITSVTIKLPKKNI